ncbi:MAG: glycosyltransferase family 4 protein [Nitrospira sp.]|nr:glycosyltransferase family 4 protein [Nitrospira sp.]
MNWWVSCYWHEPDASTDPVGLVRIWALADSLVSGGDDVTVFAPRYRSSLMPRRSRVVPIPMLPGSIIRPISYAVLAFFSGLWQGFWKRPTVVYYRWMESLHPLLLARLFGAVCLCEINGEPVPPWGAAGWRGRLTHALASFALRRCDRVVVLTEGLGRLVQAEYAVPADHVVLLPSGTDASLFRPMDKTRCVQEAGLDPACEYIGFVGSFYRYQGLATLLEAFEYIRARRPSVRLLMVGDGEEATVLHEQAARRGLSAGIVWTGRVAYSRVPVLIGVMDVCVAPFCGDRGETSPVKIFDYLACGKPVVASAIPSVSAIFSQSNGVVLVEPDCAERLADAVSALLDRPEESRRLGRDGRLFVEKRFGWEAIARGLRALVEKHTAHHQPRGQAIISNAGEKV